MKLIAPPAERPNPEPMVDMDADDEENVKEGERRENVTNEVSVFEPEVVLNEPDVDRSGKVVVPPGEEEEDDDDEEDTDHECIINVPEEVESDE